MEDCYLDENGIPQKNTGLTPGMGADGKRTGKDKKAGFFTENDKTYYLGQQPSEADGLGLWGRRPTILTRLPRASERYLDRDYYADAYGPGDGAALCNRRKDLLF